MNDDLSRLDALLREVRQICWRRGKRAELARFVGVPLPRVSEWLSGRVRPGGEATLAILAWWQSQEERNRPQPSV